MIFQSLLAFSLFTLPFSLLYLFCLQFVCSLAEISINFINYLMEFEYVVQTLKRFILLCFLNLNLVWCVSELFHMKRGQSEASDFVLGFFLVVKQAPNSSPAFGRFAGPSKGGSIESQSPFFFGLLITRLKRDPNSYTFRV